LDWEIGQGLCCRHGSGLQTGTVRIESRVFIIYGNSVTNSRFDRCVRIEQVRYIEKVQELDSDPDMFMPDLHEHPTFEERLSLRARHLVEQHELAFTLARADKVSRYAVTVAILIAVFLGATGVFYAVAGGHSINIYWLLLVLLGFNFASMALWLVGISLNVGNMASGVLAKLTVGLATYLNRHGRNVGSTGSQADRAWFACNFTGTVGKWRFSRLTHQLWLVYLASGLVVLVMLLMVRQFDFTWGTTLLSEAFFARLTEILGAPLKMLGFATPSVEQVLETQIGAGQILDAGHRYYWAQFLLGALLCYGIVPRVLLWGWSTVMLTRARKAFSLDYYLPYYIELRQQLMPLTGHGEIVDADTTGYVPDEAGSSLRSHQPLPREALWVGVELGDSIDWPPSSVDNADIVGQVIDRESLARVEQQLQQRPVGRLAVAVDAGRSPDRGLQRTINNLLMHSAERWLVLLRPYDAEPVSKARLAAWYRLAETSRVPADHVISIGED
jgi:hypothetical protein